MADEKQPEQPTSGAASAGPSQPAAAKPAANAKPDSEVKEAAKAAPAKPAVPAPTPWESDLVNSLRAAFPEASFEAFTYLNQNFLIIPKDNIVPFALYLKNDCKFDMLTDLTALDYPKREKRFDVIYQLYSFARNEQLRLKVPLGEDEIIESMVPLWIVADWLEREVFDMFGIRFANHPNLKRILLPDEWEGYPLRKDYSIIKQDERWVHENLHIESAQ
jgi:NADH-quinone oxidoreductase subunit C